MNFVVQAEMVIIIMTMIATVLTITNHGVVELILVNAITLIVARYLLIAVKLHVKQGV